MKDFETEVKKVLPQLKKFILLRIQDNEDAEEILQETLVSASKSFLFYREKSSFKTWVFGIAKHEIGDFYRKRKIKTLVFSSFPFLEEIVSEALGPDEELEKKELRKEVRRVLSSLREGYGEILRLKYCQGMSMKEIALKLKMSVKAVESKLSRAREAFKVQWEASREE